MFKYAAALLLVSLCLRAETSQITAVVPDVKFYPGDNVGFEIQAVFTGQAPNNNNVARYELKEVSTKGERTVLSGISGASRGSAMISGQYTVPPQYCFECPGRVYRITKLEMTVDLFVTNGGARIASSPPRVFEVIYPTVKISGLTSMAVQSEASGGKFDVDGFVPLDSSARWSFNLRHATNKDAITGAANTPPVTKPAPCPDGELFAAGSYFYPCNVTTTGSSFTYSMMAYFLGADQGPAMVGQYDLVVSGPAPTRTAPAFRLSAGYADAVLPAVFTIGPPKTDDSTKFLRASMSAIGKPAEELSLAAESIVDLAPGATALVGIYPEFMLSRVGYGILWCVVRDRSTGSILKAQGVYVVNTRGVTATKGYNFNLGQFGTSFTVPESGNPFEVYLALTPLTAKFGDPYDESKAFGFSSKLAVKLGKSTETVPGTGPTAPQPTDTRFVASSGRGIRTPCLKRSQGPIEIPIDITRVVGTVTAVGNLEFPKELKDAAVVSATAVLKISSFGRRLQGTSNRSDKVFLNGKALKPLTGENEQWAGDYSAELNIEDLLFPERAVGGKPKPRSNMLRIEIDSENAPPAENWCVSVGWAAVNFSALAPVVFVHGNGQGDDNKGWQFWEGGVLDAATKPRLQMKYAFLEPFIANKIPYYNSISMLTDTTAAHGDLLKDLIPNAAAEFGAKHVHIVTHSKGGLDSRDFLARTTPKNFGAYSIHTVAGPHRGSVGPDYQIDAEGANAFYSDDQTRTEIGEAAPPNKGTSSLRVSGAAAFNAINVPFLPPNQTVDGEVHKVEYRSISADMNTDNSVNLATRNPTISYEETYGLPGQESRFDTTWATILQSAYRITGYVQSTYSEDAIVTVFGQKTGIPVKVVREIKNSEFKLNDVAVTQESSQVGPFVPLIHVKGNHSSIARPEVAQEVLNSIRKIQPMKVPK